MPTTTGLSQGSGPTCKVFVRAVALSWGIWPPTNAQGWLNIAPPVCAQMKSAVGLSGKPKVTAVIAWANCAMNLNKESVAQHTVLSQLRCRKIG